MTSIHVPRWRRLVCGLLCAVLAVGGSLELSRATACPFCPTALAPTLGEQQSLADVIVVASWQKLVPASGERRAETTFEIAQVLKANPKGPKKGEQVTIPVERPGPKGALELWFGTTANGEVEWTFRTPATAESVEYLRQSPPRDAAAARRLAFYVRYLEHADESVADDAFREFAASRFEDVRGAVESFEPARIREWLTNDNVPSTRRGLYGLMLGLSGSAEDEEFLRGEIARNPDEVRIGIDGLMGGYLYLTGDRGMDFVEECKIADPQAAFPETYAAMQALRFLWTYGSDRVSHERILQAMRKLIDRPALCDIVINDLARWKDWSLQDRLMELYGAKEYDLPSIKRAIIRYLLASTKDNAPDESGEPPAHVALGQKHVDVLRARDPKRVAEVERFFFPQ